MARRMPVAVALYVVLAGLGIGWGALRGAPDVYHHPAAWLPLSFPAGTALSVALGLVVAVATVASTRVLVRRTAWARALHLEMRDLFGPLGGGQIAALAVCSGLAEEVFFRGAMQPAVGLVLSSLVFGLVHLGPSRRFWPWTLWATVMGFVFGALHQLTGELAGPVVAHVVINYENLHFVTKYDPRPPGGDAADAPSGELGKKPEPPRLVSARPRPR